MIRNDLTHLIAPATLNGQRVVAIECDLLLGPDGTFPIPGTLYIRFADLDAAFMTQNQPGLMIIPLFAAGYDAITVTERLQDLGYAGRIAVMAPNLPKPKLVEAELRAIGPGERLSLISP